ncbi:metal resistance protein [Proteus mirabilis]|uniref:Metal resistance protein n=1 Tax=Proteus mirabilis TaxID=584 RepID=A0ABD5LT65_PROMI
MAVRSLASVDNSIADLVLYCSALYGAHVISERLASAVSQTQSSFSTPIAEQQNASEGKYSLSTCELSAKSLLSIPPLAIEPLFYTWAVLLLFGMAAIYVSRQRSQKNNITHLHE